MPMYEVFVTYSVDDSFVVEADSPEDAIELARATEDYHDLLPYSEKNGYTISWDDVNVYDVQEVDE